MKIITPTLLVKRSFILPMAVLLAAFLAVIITPLVLAKDHDNSSADKAGRKILTIYDGDNEKVVLTNEKDLKGALEEANVPINDSDIVEPGLNHELVAGEYKVNIYRARPIVITDGAARFIVKTPHQTPRDILEKTAKIKVQNEDILSLRPSNNFIEGGAGTELNIKRATPFNLVLYGKKIQAYTQAKTVSQMLKQKKIKLAANDQLSIDKNTPITAGMVVEIWRNGKQMLVQEEEIDFEVEQIQDANQKRGYKKVQEAGTKGKKEVTYEVEMRNGEELSRQEVQSLVIQEPKKQIEIIGTKNEAMPYTGGGSKSDWLRSSGIPQSEWGYAEWLVQKESGWNPNAVNRRSGACGLGQQLPCGKWAGAWNDPVAALNGMNGYVKGRYGSWAKAVEHSKRNGWY